MNAKPECMGGLPMTKRDGVGATHIHGRPIKIAKKKKAGRGIHSKGEASTYNPLVFVLTDHRRSSRSSDIIGCRWENFGLKMTLKFL